MKLHIHVHDAAKRKHVRDLIMSSAVKELQAQLGVRIQDGGDSGYAASIEPAVKGASWIMWVSDNGDAELYTKRDEKGGVQGPAINLKGKL